jgi:hypothetical protein
MAVTKNMIMIMTMNMIMTMTMIMAMIMTMIMTAIMTKTMNMTDYGYDYLSQNLTIAKPCAHSYY